MHVPKIPTIPLLVEGCWEGIGWKMAENTSFLVLTPVPFFFFFLSVSPECIMVALGEQTELEMEEDVSDLWTAVAFVILFLLSLCYSTGVTLFKVPTPHPITLRMNVN